MPVSPQRFDIRQIYEQGGKPLTRSPRGFEKIKGVSVIEFDGSGCPMVYPVFWIFDFDPWLLYKKVFEKF